MGYRMMGKLFLLFCLFKFSSKCFVCWFLIRKTCRLPVVRKRKAKEQSESMGRQIWEVEDKMESRLVMQDKEGNLGQVLRSGLPADGPV